MNIDLITSVPMVQPWDQGDKNLAYALTANLPQHRFRVLTARNEPAPEHENLDRRPVYRNRQPSLADKARIYRWLLWQGLKPGARGNGVPASDLVHLIYQPFRLSSWLSRWLPDFRWRPTLHTVPSTSDSRPLTKSLFFADRVVALSDHGRRTLQQLGLKDVLHIPPGIEVDRWQALEGQGERWKARLGLDHHPTILFPGHYGPGQGAGVMLRALPLLTARVPDVRVVFACRLRSPRDKEREGVFRQAIQLLQLTENVRLYNTVVDMEQLIGASDLVVLPLETMHDKLDIPTTLLEAMAAGKPAIVSDLAPMTELVVGGGDGPVRGGDVGFAVPPGDAAALAEAMVALLVDGGLRHDMARRGQTLVRDRFDIRQMARRYEELYQEMA